MSYLNAYPRAGPAKQILRLRTSAKRWQHAILLEQRLLFSTFYVDGTSTSASDQNAGTSLNAPLKTIDRALILSQNNNATSQADTILIRGGVYREQPFVWADNSGASVTNRTTISAYINPVTGSYENVYIDAADPNAGSWTRDGNSDRWYLNQFSTMTSGVWVDWSPGNDHAPLQQIGGYDAGYYDTRQLNGSGLADMIPGSYYGDLTTDRLYVWLSDGSDPNTHSIEYANRARAIYQPGTPAGDGYSYANFVDFKGLKFRHDNVYNTQGQDQGCAIYTEGDQRLIDCDIQWNAGVGVFLRGNSQMIDCISSNNGGNGVAAQGHGFLIEGGQYNYNYWRHYDDGSEAAIKVITNSPTIYGDIVNIEAGWNYGKGVWYDTCFENTTVSQITGNYIHDNQNAGINLEASRNYLVANNVIVANTADGIALNAAENTNIFNNTIVGNYGVAAIELDGGTRDQGSTYPGTIGMLNNSIRNNIIANNFTDYDLDVPVSAAGDPDIGQNTSDYNLFYRRGGPLHYTTGGTYLGWAQTPGTLSGWQSDSGQDLHSSQADPLFLAGFSGAQAFQLGSDSPAIGEGIAAAALFTTDYAGNPRPTNGSYSAGAFEYESAGVGTPGSIVVNTDPSIWIDDQLPDDSAMTQPDESGNVQENRFWVWNNSIVYSGAASLDSTALAGLHRQYLTGATPRAINAGDQLWAYVYIDPAQVPQQIMLEWEDTSGSWNHLASWGGNQITSGLDGSTNIQSMGPLPGSGVWTRLMVPASQVGLVGQSITGFSFDVYDGRALLDKVGTGQAPVGQITGTVYEDHNGDGLLGSGETGVAGSTVYLDLNGNGVPDSGEPTQVTDATGAYSFSRLADGNYTVRTEMSSSFIPSTIGGDVSFMTVKNGTSVTATFGVFPKQIAASGTGDDLALALTADGSRVNIWHDLDISFSPSYSIASSLLASVSFSASSGGSIEFISNSSGLGIATYTLDSLTVAAGGIAVLDSPLAATDRSLLIVNSLSVTGKLDLGSNELIVHTPDLASINADLTAGYNAGNWNGIAGITSTAASADVSRLTSLGFLSGSTVTIDGQSLSPADVLIRYTYYGDANLDGKVDGSDYSRVDNGQLLYLTGWSNGDFNYDGSVNGSDYTLLDNSYNTQGAALSAQLSSVGIPSALISGTVVSTSSIQTISIDSAAHASLVSRGFVVAEAEARSSFSDDADLHKRKYIANGGPVVANYAALIGE